MDKYDAGFIGSALWNCAKSKVGNDIWVKFDLSCTECGFLGGPKPTPRR